MLDDGFDAPSSIACTAAAPWCPIQAWIWPTISPPHRLGAEREPRERDGDDERGESANNV